VRRQVLVLQEIVERAMRVAAAYHPGSCGTVSPDMAPAPVRVYGDAEELTRMVVNLVTVPGFAAVDLVLRPGRGRARLMVTLTPAPGDTPPSEDRALRLAVASRIARRHGGIMSVCDAARGGTTVTVLLPLLRATGSTRRTTG
jgi:hypothetical protein